MKYTYSLAVFLLLSLTGCKDNMLNYMPVETDEVTYTNPVISGFNPDPSVCRVGEDYYLVTSSFEYFPGVPVYHSRDLIHWKQVGYCLTRKSQLNLEGAGLWEGIYAPTIRYHEGTFYMATTNVGGGGNFYVTTTDPAGEWSDPLWVDDGRFDPSLFFDEDGKVYYTRRGPTGIVQAEIDISTGELLTDLKEITKGMISGDAEGPHLYKINGWYYIMVAEGGSRALHMETIGRSKSPWGPFEPCPFNPILAQHEGWGNRIRGPGHADLIQAHDGSWWMFFLATRHFSYDAMAHIGRETFLAPVGWENGWPSVDKERLLDMEIKVRTLPLSPWEPPEPRDEFEEDSLKLCWMFLRNPGERSWSLTERPGYLRLWGQEVTLSDIGSPAFVGRKQTYFHCLAQASLDFIPAGKNEEAGLTIYLNDKHHYEVIITLRNGSRYCIVRKTIGDLTSEVAVEKLDDRVIILQILADPEEYSFQYKYDQDQEFRTIAIGLSQYLGTELASAWTGVVIAMYASGNGKMNTNPADFDWFEYIETNENQEN